MMTIRSRKTIRHPEFSSLSIIFALPPLEAVAKVVGIHARQKTAITAVALVCAIDIAPCHHEILAISTARCVDGAEMDCL
jgi:hypothetical protein